MSAGTIRRMRGKTMRQRRSSSSTRDSRRRPLPTEHGHAARPQATRGYQSDSSSQRPRSSIHRGCGATALPRAPPELLDSRSLHISFAAPRRRPSELGFSRGSRPNDAARAIDRQVMPSCRTDVPTAVLTTHGMPYSRLTIAQWLSTPPVSATTALAIENRWRPRRHRHLASPNAFRYSCSAARYCSRVACSFAVTAPYRASSSSVNSNGPEPTASSSAPMASWA